MSAPRPATFRFGEQAVPFVPGDTVATALLWHGHRMLSRSVKYRRARGPSCLAGDCGTCLARIDGKPNVRTCTTPAAGGLLVEPQNLLLGQAGDPADLAGDHLPVLDHHHMFVRPRVVNEAMKKVARRLAGLGTVPDGPGVRRPHRDAAPEVLVVGAGPAGRAATAALAAAGLSVVCLERRPAPSGETPAHVRYRAGVFGVYPREGVVAAIEDDGDDPGLVRYRPKVLLLATGARDVPPRVPGNDLPGVVAAAALLDACRRTGRRPPGGTVCVGDGARAAALASKLGVDHVPLDEVVRFEGRRGVAAIRTRDRTVPCRVAAFAGARSGRFELAAQAGGRVRFDGAGFVPELDGGRRLAGAAAPFAVFACGDLVRPGRPDEAAEDGRAAAARILAAFDERAPS